MGEDKGKGGSPTIVGGQPPNNDQGLGSEVPVGVEKLLAMAAVDPKFAEALLARPEETIQASGVILTPSERAILKSVGPGALGTMISGVRGVMPDEDRREFLGHSAAAMLLLAAGLGGGAASCDVVGMKATGSRPEPSAAHKYPAPTGSRPDPPEPPEPPPRAPDMGRRPIETGSRPDEPEPSKKPDAGIKRPSLSRGISPDRPRPPNQPAPNRGVRPDRPREGFNSPKTGSRPDKPKPDAGRPPKSRGISPDRPKRPRPTRGIRPDLPEDPFKEKP